MEDSSGIPIGSGGLNYGAPPEEAMADSWRSIKSNDTQPYMECQVNITCTRDLDKTPVKPSACRRTERHTLRDRRIQ